jgi:glycerol uptake facilitator-like aquaporin
VPFSGGHLNPAVSIGMNFFHKNKKLIKTLIAQVVGAFLGVTIGIFVNIQLIYSLESCRISTGRRWILEVGRLTLWARHAACSFSCFFGWSSLRQTTWLVNTSDTCCFLSCC